MCIAPVNEKRRLGATCEAYSACTEQMHADDLGDDLQNLAGALADALAEHAPESVLAQVLPLQPSSSTLGRQASY